VNGSGHTTTCFSSMAGTGVEYPGQFDTR
jgi:hypothetical protein